MRYRYSSHENGKIEKKAVVYTQDEHGINYADVDSDAVRIVERLVSAGYETYIVGGAVRDLILHKKPKDFDIVSAANPNQIKKIFRSARIIGHRFRLVHVPAGEKLFEVSTFRSIEAGSTGNVFGTIEEDVLRRDFTLNALFYDPKKQLVIDYVGGMKDIRAGRLKPVLPLKTMFIDDPVRMVRAVKYTAAAGFKMPLSIGWKIRKQAALLGDISPSRRTEEMLKIIRSSNAAKIVESLENFGLYQYLQTKASALMKENPAFREAYLKRLAALNQEESAAQSSVRAAAEKDRIAALVWDFLENSVDWSAQTSDDFKKTFYLARDFVLPMNPPRVDLDGAVKLVYKEHGSIVKFPLFQRERSSRRKAAADKPTAAASVADKPAAAAPVPPPDAPQTDENPKNPKRKRKKRARKAQMIPHLSSASVEAADETLPNESAIPLST